MTEQPTAVVKPRKGDICEVQITDWGDRGRGIARLGSIVVLTDRGLPGDIARVRITKKRRRHLEARVEEITTPSPQRIDPPCAHFGLCGGCRLLDYAYPQQVTDKVRHVTQQLKRIGKLETIPEIDVIPCEPPFRYRNKMEFSFGGFDGSLTLGLHPRENFRDAFKLEECWLTDKRAAVIVDATRAFFAEGPEAPYHPVEHTGFLRFLVVRFGQHTGDILVNLVTADAPWIRGDEFAAHLRAVCPDITTALWTVNPGRANTAIGEIQKVFFGPGCLHEKLGRFELEIAPGGFFQTNTPQAELLFARVIEYAQPVQSEVLDLYSGAGAISLLLSEHAASVTGVESYPDSVTAAERNAQRNGVENCRFICADTLEYLRGNSGGAFPYASVVVDPPRAGLHPKVVHALREERPPRLVYVSCNTGNLARDLELFGDAFRLVALSAVDMFPHTPHVEAVALLEAE